MQGEIHRVRAGVARLGTVDVQRQAAYEHVQKQLRDLIQRL